MARRLSLFIVGLLMLALTACGYRPLYGTTGDSRALSADLSQIAISEIPDRMGYLVRSHLVDRIAPTGSGGRALWRLDVGLEQDQVGLAVLEDRTLTRFDVRVAAAFQLVDLQTNRVVLDATVRSSSSYNVASSDFATVVAERDAEERIADRLSEEITTHLALYFERQRERGR